MSATLTPVPTSINLEPLLTLRAQTERLSLRLLAGDRVDEPEYRSVLERHAVAARAFVQAVTDAFAPGTLVDVGRIGAVDALTLAADRISGVSSLSALWDHADADRQAHAYTVRLLDERRRQGATSADLWALYAECEPDLSDTARHDVTAWLRALEG
jgi:hypothetical protein